jgi:uncharacterized protein (DUF362 family)
MPPDSIPRRAFVTALAASVPRAAPAARVALARCPGYGPETLEILRRMFDQLGGLGRLVSGKTVAVKLNLGGPASARLGALPVERTNWVHPRVIGSVIRLLDAAGARRIRLLEGARYTADPLAEHMLEAGWEPLDFLRAGRNVELENTNVAGPARSYARFPVPEPLVYPSFLLNKAYADCDVFVSLAKLKEHVTAGLTLSMKNCFGITPASIYGDSAGADEPDEKPQGGRGEIFHRGARQPASAAAVEIDRNSPRAAGWRVPRIVVDIAAARPIDLAIIDGVESMAGGEGVARRNARPARAGVLIAGLNCVNVDAVGAAVMGFDPLARRGAAPFEDCESFLELAERRGLGSRDLAQIEIAGEAVKSVRYAFRDVPLSRAGETAPPAGAGGSNL